MSQARMIYPLLEGFTIGKQHSAHNGVRCYPAIHQKTGETYILKIISLPASRVQLDALLFTGAYASRDEAMRYYKSVAQDVLQQANILSQLSNQEGFADYCGSQLTLAPDESSYEVYLLGTCKQSLEHLWKEQCMTQRSVLEMALDLCAALAACRRAGYLYIDLQPGNVFFSREHGFVIGDIGFTSLRSLQFAALPQQYRNRYTAPEMTDDLAQMNPTLDIYALGLILFQACNGGALPSADQAAPLYADYELSEIICKACHADYTQRWQDPTQLAQALIAYMQRNEVSDTPFATISVHTEPEVATEDAFLPEITADELQQEILSLPENEVMLMEAMADQTQTPVEPLVQLHPQIETQEEVQNLSADIGPEPELPAHSEPQVRVQRSRIQTPSEAVPCPIERRPFPWKYILGVLSAVLIIVSLLCGKYYYSNMYLQCISELTVTQEDGVATVKILSGIDESLLTIVCTDSYGNALRAPVTAGIAVFSDLDPQTHYTVRVEISGFHKLIGTTVQGFTTPARTHILSFTAFIGPEDGSVVLNLAHAGPDVESWTVTYGADGTGAIASTFRGDQVTLYDLVIGKTYTFSLSASGQTLSGATELTFTATPIILAQDLAITACGGGSITAQWAAPEGFVPVSGWAVRCYNSMGFDETALTYEPHYTFTGLDHSVPCTIEVRYAGMMQSVSTGIGANPITVEAFDYTISKDTGLTIRWSYRGAAPEGGWNVVCTIDGKPVTLTTAEPFITAKAFPGATYHISISPADGSSILGGESSYVISEVAPFLGYGVDALTLSAQIDGKTITVTAPADATVESTEDAVAAICLIHTEDGVLFTAFEDTFLWNTIWDGNVCTMLLPLIPDVPGNYVLSIYFNGAWLAEVEFTVEST